MQDEDILQISLKHDDKGIPTGDAVDSFVHAVGAFLDRNPTLYVGVHCHLG